MEQNLPSLPEVPLKWQDFVWSLEKLRHKSYSKKVREKDWFRINPLEMVLMGCQTLQTCSKAARDHGTIVLSMEDISGYMSHRPRYWTRLVSVLRATIEGGETPGLIVQRCSSALVQVWTGMKKHKDFWPGFFAQCITDHKMANLLDQLLAQHTKHLSPATHQDLCDMSIEVQSCNSDAAVYIAQLSTDTPPPTKLPASTAALLDQVFRLCAKKNFGKFSKDSLSIQFRSVVSQLKVFTEYDCLAPAYSIADVVCDVVSCFDDGPALDRNIMWLFDILLLVVFKAREVITQDEEMEKAKELEISEDEDEDDDGKENFQTLSHKLFAQIALFLRQWSKQIEADPSVVAKFLEMVHTSLASAPLTLSLSSTVFFLTSYLETLMSYSTEGYLSDNPTAFFWQLLEFVSSLAEQGIGPSKAIQQNLPNLFGPFFGVRHHLVSCRLLEYGYLSVCSQHKNTLLREGIQKIVSLWHLFPAIDRKIAEEKALHIHRISLEVCESILEDLVSYLPLPDTPIPTRPDEDQPPPLEGIGKESEGGEEDEVEGEVSEEIRQKDRDSRIMVLLQLLGLACAMVRNGDSIVYLYASPLPRLFSTALPTEEQKYNREKLRKFFGEEPPPPPSSINWNVDKKPLALQLLSLCCVSLENDMATPFQLCAIILPKLVRNLDSMTFSDQEKLKLTMDILNITQETLEAGHDIEELVSHGLELLSTLLPPSSTSEELREFIQQMVQQLVTSGQTSLLFMIRNACVYVKDKFPEDCDDTQRLFRTMVFKGRRNEIRSLFKVCRDPLEDDLYTPLRRHLYGFGRGQISGRQLQAICELIVAVMDLKKSKESKRDGLASFNHDNEEEETEQIREEKRELARREGEVLTHLVQPCLLTAEQALTENRFKRDTWEAVQSQVSRLSLFRTLFSNELVQFYGSTNDELQKTFQSKFPAEVLADGPTMDLLSMCATRIEHMQVPRYQSLKTVLSQILCHYLTVSEGKEVSLERREELLLEHVSNFPRNSEDRDVFVGKCGYSERLWREEFKLSVKTDGCHSLEENMRQTLLACYTEFVDILKQMSITHVSVDGDMVKSVELFDEMLTLAELKGRRAVAVRAIDQRLGGMKEGHFHERKLALLSKEDDIEADFEEQAKAPIKPRTFAVRLNINFFDCAKCCGSQIIGCYAPTGEHCERPLEVGMRLDSGFLSIHDENGKEMENVEFLLCEEGLYVFKAYTNGHPYDTSQVWIQTFTEILQGPNPLVPAIIVPKTFPNQRTWDLLLRSSVQTELTGSLITCRHDFSAEWRTYYDHRPEKVRCGVDMVLHPGFMTSGSIHGRPVFMRQMSKVTKDLAGMMFNDAMQTLLEDEDLKQFRFLGKHMSQFISYLVDEGVSRIEILNEGFDYNKWRRTLDRQKNKMSATVAPPSKEEIVSRLANFLEQSAEEWCKEADVKRLCQSSHKQLLQMKSFLDKYCRQHDNDDLRLKHQEVNRTLIQCTYLVPVSSLSRPSQEELIHWIFRNEDRVWRYRGGRDGHETLQQFMSFIGTGRKEEGSPVNGPKKALYPGVAVFVVPSSLSEEFQLHFDTDFGVSNLIGYSIGEMVVPQEDTSSPGQRGGAASRWQPNRADCYEVVTSWVNPQYRRLNLSVQMYFNICRHAPSRLVVCDMLVGSVERIINSNPFLRFLQWTRVLGHVIWRRQDSYSVEMQTGSNEQFEQVVFCTWPVRICLMVIKVYTSIASITGSTPMSEPNQVE